MLNDLYLKLGGASSVSVIVISVAIILISGFLMTRLTKLLKLPNVTAYIITGILIGPFCLNLIPKEMISGMGFISDIALAFIAFGVGEYFRLSVLKGNGKKVIIITFLEALFASLLVFVLSFFVLRLSLIFSVILGALASATSPASTMMTIRQTKAKGEFVNTILPVIAIDTVVSLITFSIAISLSGLSVNDGFSFIEVLLPILYNILVIGVGVGLGFLLKFVMQKRSTDNRLIVSVAFLFVICGVGAAVNVSPLLGCMAMGMVYINATEDEKLFKQLNYFSPPILLLFFVRSGLNFRLDALFSPSGVVGGIPLIVIGLAYFVVRFIGKYAGSYVGCSIVKTSSKVRNHLGFALMPQASVAIGLVAIGSRIIGGETGALLETVILTSSILYELVGPALAKMALYRSGAINGEEVLFDNTETKPKENGVDELKEYLKAIEKEIAKKEYANTEEEKAFMDSSEEDEYNYSDFIRTHGIIKNRR